MTFHRLGLFESGRKLARAPPGRRTNRVLDLTGAVTDPGTQVTGRVTMTIPAQAESERPCSLSVPSAAQTETVIKKGYSPRARLGPGGWAVH
jgi:hypothetical protein